MKTRNESKNTIYIRTCGDTMTIAIAYPNEIYYKDYTLSKMDEKEKNNMNTILKIHKNWPINIMYEDFKKLRRIIQK